ncbi:anti-sigma regulatory factor [Paraburkholderia sp. D15]|uniref:anti-sigma regulatory factor n=1 Tax=Paraburkholderia sp. D15 TaxID=2880218 RepID=UPI00247B17C0|nr:anti-sigma regulatory factor [Paraburkholderia sp. D15]WGS53309.1 anti-sigma regulatory factor [Paraburkholderia sp. D15]WKF61243.1 Serine/threonine-protein kinase RsbT [Paraburkholderia busanensis]
MLDIRSNDQVNLARKTVQDWATRLAFGTLERTKFVTAASELARNTLVHGKGGTLTISEVNQAGRAGLKLVFEDAGPGIPNIDRALEDGFSTAKSMGLGLGGARRLVNEFEITSTVGQGTRVSIIQWKRR